MVYILYMYVNKRVELAQGGNSAIENVCMYYSAVRKCMYYSAIENICIIVTVYCFRSHYIVDVYVYCFKSHRLIYVDVYCYKSYCLVDFDVYCFKSYCVVDIDVYCFESSIATPHGLRMTSMNLCPELWGMLANNMSR